jgi:hypothetical protein
MAVSAEELSCLDVTIWLQSQSFAAEFLKLSQPCISRNIKKVIRIFDIDYFRLNGEYQITSGESKIRLGRERTLHQELRFHDLHHVLRYDAYNRMKTNLNNKAIKNSWRSGKSLIQSPSLFRELMDVSILDAYMDYLPEAASISNKYASIPISRYQLCFGVAKNHPLLSIASDKLALTDVCKYSFYFGSSASLPLSYKALSDEGLILYKGKNFNRVKDIVTLIKNKNYTFPIMPGSEAQFDKDLINLFVKVPIVIEDRLIIDKKFEKAHQTEVFLSNIKESHKSCSTRFPGWIESLL